MKLGLAIKSFPVWGGGLPFDWYVDSVNGNDSYAGMTPGGAFKTISALISAGISAGDRIGLARGSTWHEQLTMAANDVRVSSYGSGNAPLLDASDNLANASFAKTGGQTNVYEIAVSLGAADTDEFVNAWEDGAFLTRAADLATCDSTPGSYLPTAEHGDITLYIHASDSSDITANGKTYDVSVRSSCITTPNSGIVLIGIRARRNRGGGGSIHLGANAIMRNCDAEDGGKHNIYIGTGSRLYSCTAKDLNFSSSATLYIFNADTPNGEGVGFYNCTAEMTAYNTSIAVIGFFGHQNVSGSFGAIVYDTCTIKNVLSGFQGEECDSITITNPTCIGCNSGAGSSGVPVTWTGGTWTGGNATNQRIIANLGGAADLSLDGLDMSGADLNAMLPIYSTAANSVRVTNCDFTFNSITGLCRIIYLTNASASLYSHGNTFRNGWTTVYFCNALSVVNVDSDYNAFIDDAEDLRVGGSSYASVAAYQLATGLDAHSTVGA